MRHRNARRKLGRTSSHRWAMYSNMLASLVEHGRIQTTERKARELKSLAEKAVTQALSLGDLLLKDPENLPREDKLRLVHAVRLVRRRIRDPHMVLHLFREVAPKYLGRPGGYTRVLKTGFRRGDGAPMALIEFIEAEMPEREWDTSSDEEGAKKRKGLLSRVTGK